MANFNTPIPEATIASDRMYLSLKWEFHADLSNDVGEASKNQRLRLEDERRLHGGARFYANVTDF